MVPRLWPPGREAGREREVGSWAPRREASRTRARAGEDRGRPYQLVQLAVRMEAPALIAWWPAEVLSNGLADCCSHYRGGLHLPGSRPSAPRMPLLPRDAQLSAAVCCPPPCPCPLPGTEKAGSGPTWPQPRAGKGHGHKWPEVPQPGLGEIFPCQDPSVHKWAELWVLKPRLSRSHWVRRIFSEDVAFLHLRRRRVTCSHLCGVEGAVS